MGALLRQDGTEIGDPTGEMINVGEYVILRCRLTDDPSLDYEKQIYCGYDNDLGLGRLFGDLSCFGMFLVFYTTRGAEIIHAICSIPCQACIGSDLTRQFLSQFDQK